MARGVEDADAHDRHLEIDSGYVTMLTAVEFYRSFSCDGFARLRRGSPLTLSRSRRSLNQDPPFAAVGV
jgi:hypothetical protein